MERFGISQKVPSELLPRSAGSQEGLLLCLWRTLLNIQITSFPSSTPTFSSIICYISIFSGLYTGSIKVIPAFFFFFELLPFSSCTHSCVLFKASISLPVMLLIYSQCLQSSFLFGSLSWSKQNLWAALNTVTVVWFKPFFTGWSWTFAYQIWNHAVGYVRIFLKWFL